MRTVQSVLLLAASSEVLCASAHHAATGRYDTDLEGLVAGEITDH